MKITHSISLDFQRYTTSSQINVVQDDTYSRYLAVSLYDNKAEWPVPDGATIAVRFKKPDKTQGVYDTLPNGEVAYSIDGNVVTVGIAPQMLVAKGKVTASAVIYLGSVQLATFPFVLNVIENPAAGQSVSRDYYYLSTFAAVNEAIGDLNNLQTSTKESLVAAINELAQGTVNDIRLELKAINDRLTAFFDSDDITLDELSEIVAYITSNKTLIESITTSKVSVADIVNNLTTNFSNKPLSAAQGVVLKGLIDDVSNSLSNYQPKGDYALRSELPTVPTKVSAFTNDAGYLTQHQDISGKLDASALPTAINTALAQAQASGVFDGKDGEDGEDGHTPVKYVDYYTDADKAEFEAQIATELAKRGQLKPEFANSIEECTDTTKVYVLPDGYIYGYLLTTVSTPDQPQYTNVLPTAIDSDGSVFNGTGYKNGYRLNSSATEKETSGCGYTGFIKVTPGQNNVIRMKNIELCVEGFHYVHGYDASFVLQGTALQNSDMLTKDANGVVTFTVNNSAWSYIIISNGVMNAETIITVNEEIKVIPGWTTTEYRWTNTGHAFVPADYEDRIVAVENKATSNAERIAVLENKPSGEITLFIAPTGNDSNDGLTESTPKKTVAACVEVGASRISAKRGIYNEAISLQNIGSLEIFPTDNEKAYVVGENRDPIVFDTSDVLGLSSVTAYNSIKRIAYSNASNTAYDKVFVQKTLEPTVSASQSSYHAALWLFSDDEKTVCRKPKPVLTIAECEAEVNTFCYYGGYIYINADMAGVTKIIVPTIAETGFYVNGVDKLSLREVEVRFAGEYTFDLQNCAFVDLYKCASKYTTRASGFHPVNTNGVFRACYATKCFDGFAPNGHGHTTYIDCVSEYNFDDGMSHHSGTEGTVIGGRYEGNGKGGNTPAYGAKVNIYGGLYKNNAQFGIGYVGSEEAGYVSGIVQGAVMVNNPIGLLVQANCDVTAMSCVYKNNTAEKENHGLLTEY